MGFAEDVSCCFGGSTCIFPAISPDIARHPKGSLENIYCPAIHRFLGEKGLDGPLRVLDRKLARDKGLPRKGWANTNPD